MLGYLSSKLTVFRERLLLAEQIIVESIGRNIQFIPSFYDSYYMYMGGTVNFPYVQVAQTIKDMF